MVCLRGGVFTRTQWTSFLSCHHEHVRRAVPCPRRARRGRRRESARHRRNRPHLPGRRIYRAPGAEHIRHRRDASTEVLMRRLLSLDYVIEHTGLPWLPTEPEKVGAFEVLGLERELLPSLLRRAAGTTRRYFPVKQPLALEAGRAVFVYADPGHETTTALRSWGDDKPRIDPSRPRLADGAPRRDLLPMTGSAFYAALECENDVGGRFTLWRCRDSHRTSCVSACAVASRAAADRPVRAARAAPTVTSDPPVRGPGAA